MLGNYIIENENSVLLLEVELSEKLVHPVHQVAMTHAMLIQKMQVDLGVCIFFCLESKEQDDLIIGNEALDRFELSWNIEFQMQREKEIMM
eukprot:snap_masked-scaffold_37-processed-gene-0.3-mRNA-1 protein AED:1.00 eAED:1.00 QI:0/-1/0/0/-1/1/1/0/90